MGIRTGLGYDRDFKFLYIAIDILNFKHRIDGGVGFELSFGFDSCW